MPHDPHENAPQAPDVPFEIEAAEVKRLLDAEEPFFLLDVRTPEERAIVRLEDAALIPIQEISERAAELEPHRQRRIVVFCHHGGRSEMVANWLRGQGFAAAQNMTGGIDAWAVEIDPSLPRY